MNLAVKLNFVVKVECVSLVLFPARCRLTLCYPPQSNKDVVVLVRCSQQLIREGLTFGRTNTIAIGSLKKKNLVRFQLTCKQYSSKNIHKFKPKKLMCESERM